MSIDFTGRELLVASLYEKCYDDMLKGIIESLQSDTYELEQKFLISLAERLEKCDNQAVETGIYEKSCLFDVNTLPSAHRARVEKCF